MNPQTRSSKFASVIAMLAAAGSIFAGKDMAQPTYMSPVRRTNRDDRWRRVHREHLTEITKHNDFVVRDQLVKLPNKRHMLTLDRRSPLNAFVYYTDAEYGRRIDAVSQKIDRIRKRNPGVTANA